MDVLPGSFGARVLVVEDEYLIASYLAEDLEALGFEVVGPFDACAEALAWLASDTPDAAVLDIKLRDGTCLEIARELKRRGVLILFYTGLSDWKPFHDEFAGANVLYKPLAPARLALELRELCGRMLMRPALSAREPKRTALS